MKKIYLDCAATTPTDKNVLKAMKPYFSEKFGNPGSLHSFGQEAMAAIDESREKIAKAIGADFREIIFTGSATEANNLALRGAIRATRLFFKKQSAIAQNFLPLRIIVSTIEHESILETCRDLEKEGVEVVYLPVDKNGVVNLKKLKESLNENTILVSIMHANNVIGTIQPIKEIVKAISEFRIQNSNPYPFFHTDAVQAFQFLNCNVNDLGVDLMTLSAHKIYGPKGIGLLYVKNKQINQLTNQLINPIITGGGQEFGLRSGTENVPAIVGFAKAVEIAVKNRKKETKRITELANYFWKEIKKICPKAEINSVSEIKNQKSKIPNILNIYFSNQNSQDLLMKLDLAGVAVSSGSACSARAVKTPHVLKAIDCDEKRIKNSLRFSFGKFTTKKEIDETIKRMKN